MLTRIFIGMHYLELGGAEISLIGLLQAIDYTRYDVDLFIHSHQGELMDFIPKEVHLLPEEPAYAVVERPMTEALRRGCLGVVLGRLRAKWLFKHYARKKRPMDGSAIFGYVGRCVTPFLPSLKKYGEYDLAISFLTPHDVVYRKVCARRKACWIHTDYTRIDVNATLELPVWSAYDHVVSISPDVTATFLQVFPSLRNKVVEIENILSPTFVRQRAELMPAKEIQNEMPKRYGVVNLLTIGRYSPPKKLEEIPAICHHLLNLGVEVHWYIIGFGGSDAYIREAIQKEGMEHHVTLLGKKANPYPYIKACDWYVQPSRYEGKSVVVREAQILRKPVIITAYPTASSQINDGTDGVIVPMPVKECAEAIADVLCDEAMKERLIAHLSTHDYGNMTEIEKVYRLME